MSTNPMQRKSRNAFLLGMFITIIIFLVIGALLYILVLKNYMMPKNETITYVYRLKTDVKSGGEINQSMVEAVEVSSKVAPTGAFPSKVKENSKSNKMKDSYFPGGYKSKIALSAGTIIGSDMVYLDDEMTNDLRLIEYNMITLPTNINVGDYIDIRLSLSNGEDYIVITKAEIKSIQDSTIGLYLSEEEILMMNSAIVEAYIMTASNLYAVQFVEPGIQEAAILTYTPTTGVQQLIASDANIITKARETLEARFSDNIRAHIDSMTGLYVVDSLTNIETGIQEQMKAAKEARENYLKELNGTSTETKTSTSTKSR